MRGQIAVAAAALVTTVATTAGSLEWPVAEPRLEVSFGERTGGTIARGVRLRSSAATVHAAGDGEAIFVRRTSGAGSLPASLGGMVVVVHAGGLRSAYSGLTPTFDPATNGASVAIGAQLGTMEESAGGPSLLFSLHDAPSRSAVNPANLLPRLADAPRPVISAVRVVVATAGRYHIEVAAGGEPAAPPPYRAELLVDGREARAVTFDSLVTTESSGIALSDGETPAHVVVPARQVVRFADVALRPGERHLTIVLSNLSGDSVVRDEVVSIGAATKESSE